MIDDMSHRCQDTLTKRELRSQPTGAQNQATALRAEGVTVTTGALGELEVDFGMSVVIFLFFFYQYRTLTFNSEEYGWFPRRLPSEVTDGESSEDSSGGDED